ncbi:DNA repair protein RecN [Odoribacter laneus]|uniref:DNA repair protein RecN n=1 Tax=Odoribacter laneus TaxID=626933 RepID=UPI0023F47727|nr:DNA repair protein RecN [Odoribacter laneus]
MGKIGSVYILESRGIGKGENRGRNMKQAYEFDENIMIESIGIYNYALIEQTEIEMQSGLSVITGETGAGKSILLGAIGLTLGQRADVSVLMNKGKKCIVEILYNIKGYSLADWFQENELDYSESVVVRREITAEGRSRGFINDTPVSNKILKEFGDYLVDIHSQHQSLLLGQPEYQIDILDAFCGNTEEVAVYRKYYEDRRAGLRELKELKGKAVEAAQEEEYLKYRLSQLESAKLKKGEKEELEEELALLTNAETIKTGFSQLTYQLRDTENNAVLSVLKNCKHIFASLRSVVKEATEYEDRLNSVILELGDLAEEAEKRAENTAFSPERIELINARLNVIYDLLFKYKVETVEELIQIKGQISAQLSGIQEYTDRIEQLEKKIEGIESHLQKAAAHLHAARVAAQLPLCKEMECLLQDLGIKHARFEVAIREAEEFLGNGKDEVSFLFAANKNQQPGEIAKVASGGEISRVMLSLKYVLSKTRQLPVIVFDEIDTGLSGEIAHRMAQMMQEMAQRMQVICISHLPQIAAAGKDHFKVYKEDNPVNTISRIRKLSPSERVNEIAGMISGSEITPAALETARNLLKFENK